MLPMTSHVSNVSIYRCIVRRQQSRLASVVACRHAVQQGRVQVWTGKCPDSKKVSVGKDLFLDRFIRKMCL